MCTAGFWKDLSGNIIFFKNRDNKFKHSNERYEHIEGGLFIRDDDGKFEGMNRYGVFIVALTLQPTEQKNDEKSDVYMEKVLMSKMSAKDALDAMITYHKGHAYASSLVIGDLNNIYLLEVVPNRYAYADLTEAPYFVQTNHGQLLFNQGADPRLNPTRSRLPAAWNLIKDVKSVEDIKKMLSYHNGDASICRHKVGDKSYTQSSYLFYPKERKAEILIGNYPCCAPYSTVYLDETT